MEASSEAAASTPTLGLPLSNTSPGIDPGPEPVIGRYVKLERFNDNHISQLYTATGPHEAVWTYMADGPFNDPVNSPTLFAKAVTDFANAVPLYSVIKDGQAQGVCNLGPADLPNRVVEIGMIYGPILQRTREGTEAVYLLASLAFETLNYRRLEWKCDSLNAGSVRAAQRYGFTYEGCLRDHRIVKGRNRDTNWYSILEREWPLCKRAFETWLDDANFDEQGTQRRSLEEIRRSLSNS